MLNCCCFLMLLWSEKTKIASVHQYGVKGGLGRGVGGGSLPDTRVRDFMANSGHDTEENRMCFCLCSNPLIIPLLPSKLLTVNSLFAAVWHD